MPVPNRIRFIDRDLSGFVTTQANETGAIVLDSIKGRADKPIFCESEQDVILHFGRPTAKQWGSFEAINFCRVSPSWVVSAIGLNALFAGVDVTVDKVISFGIRTGRIDPNTIDFSQIERNIPEEQIGIGDGINAIFNGNLANLPVTEGKLLIKKGGVVIAASDAGGVISGLDIVSGTIDYNTGAISLTLNGTPGSVATYTSKIDLTGGIDLSTLASPGFGEVSFPTPLVLTDQPVIPTDSYSLRVNIDGGGFQDIGFAVVDTNTWQDILLSINGVLTGATASINSGNLRITSDTVGNASSIEIQDGTTETGGGFLSILNSLGLTPTIETPVSGKNVGVKITVDGQVHDNIDLGNGATDRNTIVNDINSAVGQVIAANNDTGGEFIDLSGLVADASIGSLEIDVPTNLESGISTIFDSVAPLPIPHDNPSTDPTGAIPKTGQSISADYVFETDLSNVISHSFFATSPYNDSDFQLAVEIEHLIGSQYQMTLFEVTSRGNVQLEELTYSLLREKDDFGRSLYIFDVFEDHPHLIPVANEDFTGTAIPTVETRNLTGGKRGDTPQASDFNFAWSHFQKTNNFGAKIFMDIYGNSSNTLENLLRNFQPYAFGITMVPFGNDADDAISHRSGLGIDYDNLALYTNWERIEDIYNNSSAWVSGVGKVGVKYAQMQDVFDGLSPAGVDENNHGGQMFGFRVLEMENDYSPTDLKKLDNSGINPKILHEIYGPIIVGDRTLQVTNSDTSFVGTRRVYNLIIDNVIRQVLQKQVFKLNDAFHRLQVKTLAESIIQPVLTAGLLSEVAVQADEFNNTPEVLNRREFILDIFVKVTPNSQLVTLRFTRLSQTQTVVDFLGG